MAKNTPKGKSNAEGFIKKIDKSLDKAFDRIRPKDGVRQWLLLAIIAMLLILDFRFILDSPLSALHKFVLSAIMLGAGGEFMRRMMKWDGGFGLIFFRDRSILGWIDRQAKRYAPLWTSVADIGLVFGFGLFSYFTFGKEERKNWKRMLFLFLIGIPAMMIFSWIIAPNAIQVLFAVVKQTDLVSATNQIRDAIPGQEALFTLGSGESMVKISAVGAALAIILVAFGLSGVTTVSVVGYALIVAKSFVLGIFGLGPGLSGTAAGGTPLLPGVNLPLIEGLVALTVLLIVHELNHGFLSRIARVKIDSAGVVFFGILPFGAFVDPDEKELGKLGTTAHNRILAGGSAANIVTACVALLVFLALFWATADMRLEGWRVMSGSLPENTAIYSITQNSDHTATINTNLGMITKPTDAEGKIGVLIVYENKWNYYRNYYLPPFEWMGFVMTTIALIFSLNTLVGIVNLIPLPFFDGHHVVKKTIGEGWMLNALTYIVAAAFILNFLPWLFK